MRSIYPNYGKSWYLQEEAKLLNMILASLSVQSAGAVLGRKPSSVAQRTYKVVYRRCGSHKKAVMRFLLTVPSNIYCIRSEVHFNKNQTDARLIAEILKEDAERNRKENGGVLAPGNRTARRLYF